MTSVLIKERERDRERRPCEDEGGDWSDGSNKSRNAWNHQKLEETKKYPPLEPSERAQPCPHLDFRHLAPRTVRELIALVLSDQVHGNLLP